MLNTHRIVHISMLLAAACALMATAYSAYKGHADDSDVDAILAVYPKLKRTAEEYHFHEDYDHNGGKSSFSIIAIRVKPLPKGTRDFEWEMIRDQLVADQEIVFFGALKDGKAK